MATIALCAAADKKVREEFTVTQAQASDVELVITNKNDFRTSLDKLGSAATVKYSVQSTLTDPKNEILVDIVYPEESGYTAENGWLHMANNSMPERVIFTYDVNKVCSHFIAASSPALAVLTYGYLGIISRLRASWRTPPPVKLITSTALVARPTAPHSVQKAFPARVRTVVTWSTASRFINIIAIRTK